MEFLIPWLVWNAAVGGVILTVAWIIVPRISGPVRRLWVIECTLLIALAVPLLAASRLPWRWPVRCLPATTSAVVIDGVSEFPYDAAATKTATPPKEYDGFGPSRSPAGIGVVSMASRVSPFDKSSVPAVPIAAPHRPFPTVLVLLLCLQVTAMGLSAVWWGLGCLALNRLWRHAAPVDANLLKLLPAAARAKRSRRLEVRVSEEAPTACAFGLWRACIVLPRDLVDSGRLEQVQFALAHEWAHLSRGDLWTWRLTRLAQFACWFQPAYWGLRRQERLDQDFLADAAAAETGSAVDFASFLVECAGGRGHWATAAALPLSSRPSDLARRVTMLLKTERPLERRCPRRLQAAGVCFAAAVMLAAALVRLEAQEAPPQAVPTDAAPPQSTPPAADAPIASPPAAAAKDGGETLTYKCRVLTKGTDAPIAGATVRVKRTLYGDPRHRSEQPIETTAHTTDADGNYTVVIPAEQTRERYLYIELDVEHPQHMAKRGFGYAMSMIRKNERLGERPFFETTKLSPAQPVTGRLLTPAGEPAANVRITGYQYPGEKPWDDVDGHLGSFFKERTDADGKFSLPIATPGKGAFWFQPDDAAPLGIVAPDARGDIGDVRLAAGFRVKGRVLDAEGQAVPGVEVRARGEGGERSAAAEKFAGESAASGAYERSAKTDANGEFELAPIEPGGYEFRIAEYGKTHGSVEFPGVFVHQYVTLKDGTAPLEFRALPTVTITVRNVNAAGEPKRGFEFTVFGHLGDKGGWFATQSTRPESGVCVAEIPRGLKDVEIDVMDNEHGIYQIRPNPESELVPVRRIKLGKVDADVTGIEVVRYKAPVLLIKAVDADGNVIQEFNPVAKLDPERQALVPKDAKAHFALYTNGLLGFEQQQDGRHRSEQMLPDAEWTVTVEKAGWTTDPQVVTLKEGEEREIVFTLRRK